VSIRDGKLLRIREQQAEVHALLADLIAQECRILRDPESSPAKPRRAPSDPEVPDVTDLDRVRARAALRDSTLKRKVR
jgi:hypothetical protein